MVLIGISLGVSGILPVNGYIIFAVLCFILGLSVPFYSGPQTALMQERIKPEYLGRVFGLMGSLQSFSMLIGSAIIGALADVTGINIWFLFSGIIISILAIAMIMMPSVRNIEKR